MRQEALKLAVIVGSTREGRFGPRVARWFLAEAGQRAGFAVDHVDLADFDLPTVHPRRSTPAIDALGQRLATADTFVVVTPEYNHGYPASLKHAIDQVDAVWQAKPIGFVSYGGISGGLRAVEQLRQVFAECHAVTVRDSVSFHGVWQRFDENDRPRDPDAAGAAARRMLDQLVWWGAALRTARQVAPYAAAAAA